MNTLLEEQTPSSQTVSYKGVVYRWPGSDVRASGRLGQFEAATVENDRTKGEKP